MEKNAPSEKRKSRVMCPELVITSSLKVPPSTRRFMRTLSAVTGAPIIHRGKSNLDEIAYYVKRAKFKSFVVVFSKKSGPSILTFYRLTTLGYFAKYGSLFLSTVNLVRRHRSYIGFEAILKGKNALSTQIWNFFIDLFGDDLCHKYVGPISRAIIKDLNEQSVIEFWGKQDIILSMSIRKISRQKYSMEK